MGNLPIQTSLIIKKRNRRPSQTAGLSRNRAFGRSG